MSETPRTDALLKTLNQDEVWFAQTYTGELLEFTRSLERDLAAAQARVEEERQRGDELYAALGEMGERVKQLVTELKNSAAALAEGDRHE